MGYHIYGSPPYGRYDIQTSAINREHIESGEVRRWHYGMRTIDRNKIDTGAIYNEHIESGQLRRHHYAMFSIDENKIDTGQVWTARCNAAWGYIDTIGEAIPEFPPGTEIVHDLGYVPEFVSLTKLSGGTEKGNVFLTGRTMSSIFVFAEANTSGIFLHWFAMR